MATTKTGMETGVRNATIMVAIVPVTMEAVVATAVSNALCAFCAAVPAVPVVLSVPLRPFPSVLFLRVQNRWFREAKTELLC